MKTLLIAIFSLTAATSMAANVIYANMYSKHSLVQAIASTLEDACVDAENGIPEGYIPDPGNSQAVNCTEGGIDAETKKCPEHASYVCTLPIVSIDPQ